jgi:hypothetical protein
MNLSYLKDPFPHIIGSLEEEAYKAALDSWENVEHENHIEYAGNRSNINVTDQRLCNYLTKIMLDSYGKFVDDVMLCYPKLYGKEYDLTSRILYSENIASETPYKIRGLHLDSGDKCLVGLWYFKHPEDTSSGGDLLLMNPKTKQCKRIEYGSNVFVLFPNLTTAWHAVTPRQPSKYPRRYINLLLESKQVTLHNYRRSGTSVDDEFRGKLVNYYK